MKGNAKICKNVLSHPLGDLGIMHRVHLWLDGKLIVDFLSVIIEFFLLALAAEALLTEICQSVFSEGVGRSFVRYGQGSSLLLTAALRPYSGPMRFPRERKEIGRCAMCVSNMRGRRVK